MLWRAQQIFSCPCLWCSSASRGKCMIKELHQIEEKVGTVSNTEGTTPRYTSPQILEFLRILIIGFKQFGDAFQKRKANHFSILHRLVHLSHQTIRQSNLSVAKRQQRQNSKAFVLFLHTNVNIFLLCIVH